MSKYQFNASDIYLPGTDIPKNRLGITKARPVAWDRATLLQQVYQTSIACVQQADSRMLQQTISQGMNKLDATT